MTNRTRFMNADTFTAKHSGWSVTRLSGLLTMYEQTKVEACTGVGNTPENHVCDGKLVVKFTRRCRHCGRWCEVRIDKLFGMVYDLDGVKHFTWAHPEANGRGELWASLRNPPQPRLEKDWRTRRNTYGRCKSSLKKNSVLSLTNKPKQPRHLPSKKIQKKETSRLSTGRNSVPTAGSLCLIDKKDREPES